MSEQATFKDIELDIKLYNEWLASREKAKAEKKPSRFLTLSREYGCDGYPTSIRLQELINEKYSDKWFIFTRPIMEKVIADDQLGADLIHQITETRYSFMQWFFDGIVPEYIQSPHLKVFERLRTLILNLAAKGNAIFVGGGGQIITNRLISSRFRGIHIRVTASHEFKIKSVMKKFGLNRGDAENHLKKNQSARDKFVQDFTWRTAEDNSLYHLILNNEWMSSEVMAKTILAYMENSGFFED